MVRVVVRAVVRVVMQIQGRAAVADVDRVDIRFVVSVTVVSVMTGGSCVGRPTVVEFIVVAADSGGVTVASTWPLLTDGRGCPFSSATVVSRWSAANNVGVVNVVLMVSTCVTATVVTSDVTASDVVTSVVTESTVDIASVALSCRTVDKTTPADDY